SNKIEVRFGRHDEFLVEVDVRCRAPAFLVAARSCEVDQDAAHELCANREEVSPVLPLHPANIHQSQIGFMNKCGRLKSMPGAFTGHVTARRYMELVVDERH